MRNKEKGVAMEAERKIMTENDRKLKNKRALRKKEIRKGGEKRGKEKGEEREGTFLTG